MLWSPIILGERLISFPLYICKVANTFCYLLVAFFFNINQKISMKRLAIFSGLFLLLFNATAQVNIGANVVPNANAVLELTSGGNKGFLLPRVNLTSTTNPAPLSAHVAGMLIYNLTAAGSGDSAVVPGMYINDGTKWQLLFASSHAAVIDSLSCNSGNTALGTYQTGIACTNANTKDVTVAVTGLGAYSISTDTLNGVSFTTSGSFVNPGAATVLLTATGTPLVSGTFTYTVNYGTYSCSFDITYTSAANFNCSGYTLVQNPTGTLTAGTTYTGSYSIPYTAGNGIAYASTIETIDGLTLTRQAGTYAAGGGSVVYTLSGTYANPNNGNISFPIPECTNAVFGSPDAIRDALAKAVAALGNPALLTVYDSAAANDWIQVSVGEYDTVMNNLQGIIRCGAPDSIMSIFYPNPVTGLGGPTYFLLQGSMTASVCTATDIPVPASSYIIGVRMINDDGQDAHRTVSSETRTGAQVELGQTDSLGYARINNVLPTSNLATGAGQWFYYICKRPTGTSSPGGPTHMGFYGGNSGVEPWFAARSIGGGPRSLHVSSISQSTLETAHDNIQLLFQGITTTVKQW